MIGTTARIRNILEELATGGLGTLKLERVRVCRKKKVPPREALQTRPSGVCLALPAIVFHHSAVGRIDLFLLQHEILALVPAPGLFVTLRAAQPDLVRQQLAGEAEQAAAE